MVLCGAGDEQNERHRAGDRQGDEELLHFTECRPARGRLQPLFGSEIQPNHVLAAFDLRGRFLDSGDHTEIRSGMVFTVEPGLYTPDLGGFRHSDTVNVTDEGVEILKYYPRDLASLIIPD